ncbi:hypothetical protein KC19_9G181900 [Ceratodon purpureus]|uniref:Uncharacterized protein n=1 Tax=Ceratodon purpureus TaxID=3225 RepID=A0A8T0GYU7_CERPU|nr:hypothetical protein KC19_9G181900 [Ceratodon purpureus]
MPSCRNRFESPSMMHEEIGGMRTWTSRHPHPSCSLRMLILNHN